MFAAAGHENGPDRRGYGRGRRELPGSGQLTGLVDIPVWMNVVNLAVTA